MFAYPQPSQVSENPAAARMWEKPSTQKTPSFLFVSCEGTTIGMYSAMQYVARYLDFFLSYTTQLASQLQSQPTKPSLVGIHPYQTSQLSGWLQLKKTKVAASLLFSLALPRVHNNIFHFGFLSFWQHRKVLTDIYFLCLLFCVH